MQQQGIPMKDYNSIFRETPRTYLPGFPAEPYVVTAPSSPKTSGHDTVLRAIQNKGAMITIKFLSGETMSGTLVARDSYTLTVRTPNDVRNVLFKHAIERFSGEESSVDTKAS